MSIRSRVFTIRLDVRGLVLDALIIQRRQKGAFAAPRRNATVGRAFAAEGQSVRPSHCDLPRVAQRTPMTYIRRRSRAISQPRKRASTAIPAPGAEGYTQDQRAIEEPWVRCFRTRTSRLRADRVFPYRRRLFALLRRPYTKIDINRQQSPKCLRTSTAFDLQGHNRRSDSSVSTGAG